MVTTQSQLPTTTPSSTSRTARQPQTARGCSHNHSAGLAAVTPVPFAHSGRTRPPMTDRPGPARGAWPARSAHRQATTSASSTEVSADLTRLLRKVVKDLDHIARQASDPIRDGRRTVLVCDRYTTKLAALKADSNPAAPSPSHTAEPHTHSTETETPDRLLVSRRQPNTRDLDCGWAGIDELRRPSAELLVETDTETATRDADDAELRLQALTRSTTAALANVAIRPADLEHDAGLIATIRKRHTTALHPLKRERDALRAHATALRSTP